jgi:integrase/recombinase XerD
MPTVIPLEHHAHRLTLATASATFLAEHDLSVNSQRIYRSTLAAWLDAAAGREQVTAWFHARYDRTAAAPRVRQLAILRAACTFWQRRGWLTTDPTAGLERPRVSPDRTKALTREQITALWRRADVALRERTCWRLLYESAARANEVLSLDITALDLPNKRARVRSKGGAMEWVFWQTGTALLLPRLLAGRISGPVFLADRQPTRAVPSLDRCPSTGRARLSYRRAAELFSGATTPDAKRPWTLHQLRHSALTHAAEDGTNTPMLLARSRHASVRSLERYARPGPEAVARSVAEHDPARRSR